MSNFTPVWFKKGFFNESLFCDDFLSTHQLLYSNGAFFTPDGRMVDPMPLRCEIFEMMREYVGANLAKKVTNVVDVLKLAAQVEDFPPVTDRIALANGTLYLDGTFQEGKPEIVRNRLPVKYDPKAAQPVHWLRFLSDADSAAGVGVAVADCRSRAASCSGVTLAVRTISLTSAESSS